MAKRKQIVLLHPKPYIVSFLSDYGFKVTFGDKNDYSKITTEKEELLYTMKYAHKYNPTKDIPPPFWEKDFFKKPLKRLDTSKMSPLEAAAYENALMRDRIVSEHNENKLNQAVEKAVEKTAEKVKIDSIKKLLLRGKATIEEIAEDIEVSIDFVTKVQKSLTAPPKNKSKTISKKKVDSE